METEVESLRQIEVENTDRGGDQVDEVVRSKRRLLGMVHWHSHTTAVQQKRHSHTTAVHTASILTYHH